MPNGRTYTGRVARHVRAWIETMTVPSMRAIGLVARHVRAWIET